MWSPRPSNAPANADGLQEQFKNLENEIHQLRKDNADLRADVTSTSQRLTFAETILASQATLIANLNTLIATSGSETSKCVQKLDDLAAAQTSDVSQKRTRKQYSADSITDGLSSTEHHHTSKRPRLQQKLQNFSGGVNESLPAEQHNSRYPDTIQPHRRPGIGGHDSGHPESTGVNKFPHLNHESHSDESLDVEGQSVSDSQIGQESGVSDPEAVIHETIDDDSDSAQEALSPNRLPKVVTTSSTSKYRKRRLIDPLLDRHNGHLPQAYLDLKKLNGIIGRNDIPTTQEKLSTSEVFSVHKGQEILPGLWLSDKKDVLAAQYWQILEAAEQPLVNAIPGRHCLFLTVLPEHLFHAKLRTARPVFLRDADRNLTYLGHYNHYGDPQQLTAGEYGHYVSREIVQTWAQKLLDRQKYSTKCRQGVEFLLECTLRGKMPSKSQAQRHWIQGTKELMRTLQEEDIQTALSPAGAPGYRDSTRQYIFEQKMHPKVKLHWQIMKCVRFDLSYYKQLVHQVKAYRTLNTENPTDAVVNEQNSHQSKDVKSHPSDVKGLTQLEQSDPEDTAAKGKARVHSRLKTPAKDASKGSSAPNDGTRSTGDNGSRSIEEDEARSGEPEESSTKSKEHVNPVGSEDSISRAGAKSDAEHNSKPRSKSEPGSAMKSRSPAGTPSHERANTGQGSITE